jgi:hypothetical protein
VIKQTYELWMDKRIQSYFQYDVYIGSVYKPVTDNLV